MSRQEVMVTFHLCCRRTESSQSRRSQTHRSLSTRSNKTPPGSPTALIRAAGEGRENRTRERLASPGARTQHYAEDPEVFRKILEVDREREQHTDWRRRGAKGSEPVWLWNAAAQILSEMLDTQKPRTSRGEPLNLT